MYVSFSRCFTLYWIMCFDERMGITTVLLHVLWRYNSVSKFVCMFQSMMCQASQVKFSRQSPQCQQMIIMYFRGYFEGKFLVQLIKFVDCLLLHRCFGVRNIYISDQNTLIQDHKISRWKKIGSIFVGRGAYSVGGQIHAFANPTEIFLNHIFKICISTQTAERD